MPNRKCLDHQQFEYVCITRCLCKDSSAQDCHQKEAPLSSVVTGGKVRPPQFSFDVKEVCFTLSRSIGDVARVRIAESSLPTRSAPGGLDGLNLFDRLVKVMFVRPTKSSRPNSTPRRMNRVCAKFRLRQAGHTVRT
eukprot:TRINITY_DN14310_c0_g1_i1.p1 TRINITY_DN14310_c0_g1~~TRINITY_DN14310_c0_g1_i1.p1  ORF type:complete len:137 (-),score=4.87 TRINITY_DN14310_c0_g1_i1:175-585(-)